MRFRSLDSDNDWQMGKGLNDYKREDNAIMLNIQTSLLSWVGDCFFAMESGIDWYNRLGSKSQRESLEQDIKKIILNIEGVVNLVSFSTTLTTRSFSAEYNIKTIYSPSVNDSISIGS